MGAAITVPYSFKQKCYFIFNVINCFETIEPLFKVCVINIIVSRAAMKFMIEIPSTLPEGFPLERQIYLNYIIILLTITMYWFIRYIQ